MKPRTLLGTLAVLVVAGTCVRLGFWQISRLHEKQALNAAMRDALAGPPVPVASVASSVSTPGGAGTTAKLAGHRVEMHGRFDESRQVLLSVRTHDGSPGVHVVTPLLLEDGSGAVLVDRGWLYAGDAATARPQDHPEPGERHVIGIADTLRHGAGGYPVRRLEADSIALYSARWLDLDSLTLRMPYALAPFSVRELPGPGVPDQPLRLPPQPFDESMHVSYAIQWFLFAVIALGGSATLAWTRRPRTPASPPR